MPVVNEVFLTIVVVAFSLFAAGLAYATAVASESK